MKEKAGCNFVAARQEEIRDDFVISAANLEEQVLDGCEDVVRNIDVDCDPVAGSSYEKMSSTMMEFAKKQSFFMITNDGTQDSLHDGSLDSGSLKEDTPPRSGNRFRGFRKGKAESITSAGTKFRNRLKSQTEDDSSFVRKQSKAD